MAHCSGQLEINNKKKNKKQNNFFLENTHRYTKKEKKEKKKTHAKHQPSLNFFEGEEKNYIN